MKTYEIYDEENKRSVGVLLYYDKEKSFIIELEEDLDEWTAPLLFTALVKRKIYTIPKDTSLIWVKERIIPSGRQNIGSILKNHKLKQYDEMKFLEISAGRCSQDSLYIKKIDSLPNFVLDRQQKNIQEIVVLTNYRLLCFFNNGAVKVVDLRQLSDDRNIAKIIKFDDLYASAKVGTGGYSACFNDSIEIPAKTLFNFGIDLPLSMQDIGMIITNNVLDTAESCQELGCTRQNLSYMVKQNQLKPVKNEVKGNLYFKGAVIKNRW